MATQYGLFASVDLAASNNDIFEVEENTQFVGTLNLLNLTNADIEVYVGLSATDTPTNAEWIEAVLLKADGGVIERTGIALQAGKHIVVAPAAVGVAASVWGMKIITEAP